MQKTRLLAPDLISNPQTVLTKQYNERVQNSKQTKNTHAYENSNMQINCGDRTLLFVIQFSEVTETPILADKNIIHF